MTTAVIVKANHGWPVDVTRLDPKTGALFTGNPTDRVPAGAEKTFYVHSTMDIRIHEVQPDEVAAELIAAGDYEELPDEAING